MPQFDVYVFAGEGLLLDVQADLMDGLNTRMVVPLLPVEIAPIPAKRLNPIFLIDNTRYAMVTQLMAAIPLTDLGERVGSLAHEHFMIKPAIDLLFDGV